MRLSYSPVDPYQRTRWSGGGWERVEGSGDPMRSICICIFMRSMHMHMRGGKDRVGKGGKEGG